MSKDTEQDENLGQRNLRNYFAKGICNSEAMPLTFPVLELTNSHYLILDYASWVKDILHIWHAGSYI